MQHNIIRVALGLDVQEVSRPVANSKYVFGMLYHLVPSPFRYPELNSFIREIRDAASGQILNAAQPAAMRSHG